jgi:hypothetical protein
MRTQGNLNMDVGIMLATMVRSCLSLISDLQISHVDGCTGKQQHCIVSFCEQCLQFYSFENTFLYAQVMPEDGL